MIGVKKKKTNNIISGRISFERERGKKNNAHVKIIDTICRRGKNVSKDTKKKKRKKPEFVIDIIL